ncbi:hypothetical protein EXIGLDRAFT_786931 [Exidia glandulosa HHB12029]|uniref:F-box domain-containing protein n=1 Tax=Exidia glandulosa HHB12029 TaxID=1314781 RepID=A0A166MW72_EXIGL|nr:hypothetical protein EXIGLDRAFT_786931 [Exidia glandulosa HHB12029]
MNVLPLFPATGIHGMPPELLLETFKYLSLEERVLVGQVYRKWRAVALVATAWTDLRSWENLSPPALVGLLSRTEGTALPLRLCIACDTDQRAQQYANALQPVVSRICDLYLHVCCDWSPELLGFLRLAAPSLVYAHIESASVVELAFPLFAGAAPNLDNLHLDAVQFSVTVPQPVLDTVRCFSTSDFPLLTGTSAGAAINTLYLFNYEDEDAELPWFDLSVYAYMASLRHIFVEFTEDNSHFRSPLQVSILLAGCPHLQTLGFTNAPANVTKELTAALPPARVVLFDSIQESSRFPGTSLQVVTTNGQVFTLTECAMMIEYITVDNPRAVGTVQEVVIGRAALVAWDPESIDLLMEAASNVETLTLVLSPQDEGEHEISKLLDPASWEGHVLSVPK